MPRGRPPRAGERATRRVETSLTPKEYDRVAALAAANDLTLAELVRVAVITLAADLQAGDDPAVIQGGAITSFGMLYPPR